MTQPIAMRNCVAALVLVAGLAVSSGVCFGQAADTAPAPAAHWVERKLDYTYMGFTTKYSCDGLKDNVRDLLLALGARKSDLKIHSQGCTRFDGPEPFPGVVAHFSVLEPLTPDQAGKGDAAAPAQWQTVDLTRLHGFEWLDGQCELLEQTKQKILPLFTSRNVNFRSSCFPHNISLGEIQFSVDVLRATPTSGAAPAA